MKHLFSTVVVISAALVLVSCGGGGESDSGVVSEPAAAKAAEQRALALSESTGQIDVQRSCEKKGLCSTGRVVSPAPGVNWTTGKRYPIKWYPRNVDPKKVGIKVDITLWKATKIKADGSYTPKFVRYIARRTPNDGKHPWKIPTTLAAGSVYYVAVLSGIDRYTSSSYFTITKGGVSKKDYKYLYRHNAIELSGHTVRWKSKAVQVSGAKGSWRTAVNRWQKGTGLRFRYVASKPAQGKGIQIVGYAPNLGSNVCGTARTWWRSNGEIVGCQVRVNPNHDNMGCGTVASTITHEVGHCIGIFRHTKERGLMDAYGSTNTITTRVRNMVKLLYSLPPGTDIRSKMKKTSSATRESNDSKYDPEGSKHYYAEFIVLEHGYDQGHKN